MAIKQKPPSPRAKRYIKNKLSGMSDYQAAVKAGYSPNTAKLASTNIENHSVKSYMVKLMDQMGLTDEKLMQSLQEGLNTANKIFGTGDNFVETPDYAVRHKYLDTALKLRDSFPAEKKDITSDGQPLEPTQIIIVEDKKQDE